MKRRIALSGAALLVTVPTLLLASCASGSGSGPGSGPGSGSGPGAGSAAADARTEAGPPGRLAVTGGYIPRPVLPDMAAAYLTVTNSGGGDAELVAVTTPLAAHVTLHTTTGATMRQVASLRVPAHGSLTLATGGDHMMLENLTHLPAVGEKVALTLHFARATPAATTVTVPVRPTTYTPKG